MLSNNNKIIEKVFSEKRISRQFNKVSQGETRMPWRVWLTSIQSHWAFISNDFEKTVKTVGI